MSDWKYDPEELRYASIDMIKAVNGDRDSLLALSPRLAPRTASLLDAVSEAPQTNQPLYRGMVVYENNQIAAMTAGDTVYFGPSGFSASEQTGYDYALAGNTLQRGLGSPVHMLFELEPGAKALNIDTDEIAEYRRKHRISGSGLEWEAEHIAAGGFEVVDVQTGAEQDDQGELINLHRITLRQVEPLGIPAGSASWGSAISAAAKKETESKIAKITASASATIELACYDSSCAPPPVGVGGSSKGAGAGAGAEKNPPLSEAAKADTLAKAIRYSWKQSAVDFRRTALVMLTGSARGPIRNVPAPADADLQAKFLESDNNFRRITSVIMDAIVEAPVIDNPLYRGLKLKPDDPFTDQVLGLEVGDTWDMPPSGFSLKEQVGADFTRLSSQQTGGASFIGPENSRIAASRTPVLIVLQPGARALDIDTDTKGTYADEQEHLAAGSFEVVGVSMQEGQTLFEPDTEGNPIVGPPVKVITIRQTEPLGPPEGAKTWWETTPPEEALTSALIELACHSAECAPPPVGKGGSSEGDSGSGVQVTKELLGAVHQWKGRPETVRQSVRALIEADESNQRLNETASGLVGPAQLLDALVAAPKVDYPLYRGMYEPVDGSMQRQIDAMQPGDVVFLPPSGFSEAPLTAAKFTSGGFDTSANTSTFFMLKSGAQALSIDGQLSVIHANEKEHIVAGAFMVMGKQTYDWDILVEQHRMQDEFYSGENSTPITVITLEQVEPFRPPENDDEGKGWGHTINPDPSAATASALIELACYDASCAPPPVGTGGSSKGVGSVKGLQPTGTLASDRVRVLADRIERKHDDHDEKIAKQQMETRGRAMAYAALSGSSVEPRVRVEFDMLSSVVPLAEGWVRGGTPEATALIKRVKETYPGARVGMAKDVNVEAVNSLMAAAEKFPLAARKYVGGVMLGHTENTEHLAAFGPSPRGGVPSATIWFSDKVVAPSVATKGNPDGSTILTQSPPEKRHEAVVAHEMGHLLHAIAVVKDGKRTKGGTTNDPKIPKGIAVRRGYTLGKNYMSNKVETTRYGAKNAAETVAETFAAAMVKGFGSLTPNQQQLVTDTLDRADLDITEMQFAAAEELDLPLDWYIGDSFVVEEDGEPAIEEFACYDSSCAPPPVGTGGSSKGSGGSASLAEVMKGREAAATALLSLLTDKEMEESLRQEFDVSEMIKLRKIVQKTKHKGMFETSAMSETDRAFQAFSDGHLRSIISKTLKSETPFPEIVGMLQQIHREAVAEIEAAGGEIFVERMLKSNVQQGENPASHAGPYFADKHSPQTGVISWFGPRPPIPAGLVVSKTSKAERLRKTNRVWITDTVTPERVIGRVGDMWWSGEFLISNSEDTVSRLMENKFPIVPPEKLIPFTSSALIELACYSAECAPPPVGVGGSKVSMTGPSVSKAVERNRSAKQKLEDKEIRAIAVERWKRSPELARVAMTDVLNSDAAKAGDHFRAEEQYEAAMIMDEVVGAPVSLDPLFRGMHLRPSDILYDLEVGQTVDIPPSGFTPKAAIARGFTDITQVTIDAGKKPILYQLVAGAHALNIDDDKSKPYAFELEHIVAGSFEVVGIEEQGYKGAKDFIANAIRVVTLRQVEPLGPPEGHDSWSAKVESERDWKWEPDIESVRLLNRTAVTASSLIELACYEASCAPPPVGTGGSKKGAGLIIPKTERYIVSRYWDAEELDKTGWEEPNPDAATSPDADPAETRGVVWDAMRWWKANPQKIRTASLAVLADEGNQQPISETDLDVLYPKLDTQTAEEWWNGAFNLYDTNRLHAAIVMNKVAGAPVVGVPLYRGITAEVGSDRAAMIKTAKVGDTFDWIPSGFSASEDVAAGFTLEYGQRGSKVPALFVLESGAKAWGIERPESAAPNEFAGRSEEEFIAAGSFEIVGVEMRTVHPDNPDRRLAEREVKVITIRQTEPLGFPPGPAYQMAWKGNVWR
jgi:hypothetical protein